MKNKAFENKAYTHGFSFLKSMFDMKSAMPYLLTEINFEEVLYLFKKKTNEKKKYHINESENVHV